VKIENVPAKYRTMYDRAMTGRNRAAAIKMYCLACCRWQRKEARLCACPGCPLFVHRLTGRKIPKGQTPAAVPANHLYLNGIGRWEGAYRRALTGRDLAASIRAACGICGGVADCRDKSCPLWPYRITGCKTLKPKNARPSDFGAKRVRFRHLSPVGPGLGRGRSISGQIWS
jgi:hypothetical protein